jgi:hypothetical protein
MEKLWMDADMADIKKIKEKFYALIHTPEERYICDATFDRYTSGVPVLLDNLRCLLFDKPSHKAPYSILYYFQV